ncbi:hypothetical protein LCGC14_2012860, partial [marine sediment metagenome]
MKSKYCLGSSKENLSNSESTKDSYGYSRFPETIERIEYGRFRNIYLYITEKCQLRCGHCYMGNRLKNNTSMPTEKVFSTLQLWRKMGGSKLSILGGEPTMHEDFVDICRYAKHLGYEKVILNTNGLRNTIQQLSQMESNEFSYIQVSLDGGSSFSHNKIRGSGTFNITWSTIEYLINRGFDTRVICTVNKKNRGDCLDLIERCEKAGVSLLKFHVFSTIGNGQGNTEWGMTPKEWINFYEELEDRKKHYNISIWYQPSYATSETIIKFIREGYKGCIGRTLDRISVFPDGKAYVCSYLFDTEFNMFNTGNGKILLN